MRVKVDRSHPEPVNNEQEEKTKGQTTRPAEDAGRPTQPGDPSKLRVQDTTGPPEGKDWTPYVQRPDPGGQGHRTRHPGRGPRTSWNPGLRGIRDFEGFKTTWDPGLCGIQDFAGLGTSWDPGLPRKQELYTARTRILFCGVLSENTNFQDNFKTWIPLGISLVVSVKYFVYFYGS